MKCAPVSGIGGACNVVLCTDKSGRQLYAARGKTRPVTDFATSDALVAWVNGLCPPPPTRARGGPRAPAPRAQPRGSFATLAPGTDVLALQRAIAAEAAGGPAVGPLALGPSPGLAAERAREARRVTTVAAGAAVLTDSRAALDACTAECSAWAVVSGPFPCQVEFCSLKSGAHLYRANGYVKRFEKSATADQLVAWALKVCGQVAPYKFGQPASLRRPPAPTVPGAVKRAGVQLPAIGAPVKERIPGSLEGETCAPAVVIGAAALYFCSGVEGAFYVAGGRRRSVSSFASADAVAAWANGGA